MNQDDRIRLAEFLPVMGRSLQSERQVFYVSVYSPGSQINVRSMERCQTVVISCWKKDGPT